MPPPASAPTTKRLQRGRCSRRRWRRRRGTQPASAFATVDHLAAEAEAGVDDDAGEERAAGSRSLSAYWVCMRLVAHRQPAATSTKRTSSPSAAIKLICHRPATCGCRQLRGGEHGLADEVEHRVERVEHEALEPVVDRLRIRPGRSQKCGWLAWSPPTVPPTASASPSAGGGGPDLDAGPGCGDARRSGAARGRHWSWWTRAARRVPRRQRSASDDQPWQARRAACDGGGSSADDLLDDRDDHGCEQREGVAETGGWRSRSLPSRA